MRALDVFSAVRRVERPDVCHHEALAGKGHIPSASDSFGCGSQMLLHHEREGESIGRWYRSIR